jgi:cation:H+ antiporter
VAARRGNANLAVGNVVGSNLFNIFGILGLAGTLRPLAPYPTLNHDLAFTVLASALLLLCMFTGRQRHTLDRREGGLFLGLYAAYLAYLAWQQLRP